MQYDKNKTVRLLLDRTPIKSLPEGTKVLRSLIASSISNVTVLMHGNLLHATMQMGVFRLKVFIFINRAVQWRMLTHSESTLLLLICIESLPGF